MIQTILSRKRLALALYLILVMISIGMGMGVPFFTILLGLPVGWLLPLYLKLPDQLSRDSLRALLRASALVSAASVLILAAIWLPALSWFFDPARDLAQFGVPMILYEPLPSFFGWIALMVLISPFLQFLMTILGAVLRMVYANNDRRPKTEDGNAG
jgi:uncharacterized membrane protein YczE